MVARQQGGARLSLVVSKGALCGQGQGHSGKQQQDDLDGGKGVEGSWIH